MENVDVVIGYISKDLIGPRSVTRVQHRVMPSTYPGLEFRDFVVSQRICLGDDGDKVNFGMKPTHEFNIEGLQPETTPPLWVCV